MSEMQLGENRKKILAVRKPRRFIQHRFFLWKLVIHVSILTHRPVGPGTTLYEHQLKYHYRVSGNNMTIIILFLTP
jgi:hypothetical protein